MVISILIMVLFTTWIIWGIHNLVDPYEDFSFGPVGCLILSGLLLFPGFFIDTYESNTRTEIVSLKDSNTTNGEFYLGSGSIDEKPVYFYYARAKDGSFTLENVNAAEVKIVEEDSTPYLEKYEKHISKKWQWLYPDIAPDGARPYTFHIPEGSITQSFELDTQ